METFTPARPFIHHPGYLSDRKKTHQLLVEEIRRGSIDAPLIPMIRECIPITHFFTIQCCFGHFVHNLAPDRENLIPPSQYEGKIETVRYRLAYLVICLQNNSRGRKLYSYLENLSTDNPDYIQFGSADWFWQRIVNTYCIQLEPDRFKTEDSGVIGMAEALYIEALRDDFFKQLADVIHKHRKYPPLSVE